jgi:hypothetical protein
MRNYSFKTLLNKTNNPYNNGRLTLKSMNESESEEFVMKPKTNKRGEGYGVCLRTALRVVMAHQPHAPNQHYQHQPSYS